MNIDTAEVIEGMNTKWNALRFRPGLVGGHCIGVDPYYLVDAAEKIGYQSNIILNGRKLNDSMGPYIADQAVKVMVEAGQTPKKSKVVILGITFKENCPDIRNSKIADVIGRLKEYGIEPIVYDPWADKDETMREYGVELADLDDLPKADCLIVAVGHNEFRAMNVNGLKQFFRDDIPDEEKVLLDVKSLYNINELEYSGITFWRL